MCTSKLTKGNVADTKGWEVKRPIPVMRNRMNTLEKKASQILNEFIML